VRNIWFTILAIMIGGSIAKHLLISYVFPSSYLLVVVDLAVFGISYLVLRRYPYIDLKSSLQFLAAFTVIAILVDLGIIGDLISSIALLALIGWMFYRSRGVPARPTKLRHKWHK